MTRFRMRWRFAVPGLLVPLSLQAAITDQRIDALVQKIQPQLIEWRRDIHQHPELSNREFNTSKKVAEHLRSLGLEVKTEIAHTGVVAVLRGGKPGPMIALRADMDALPVVEQVDLPFKSTVTAEYRGQTVGVMHACGHDAHVAILMAAAQILTQLRADLPGSVLFIFQPAEEGAPEGEEGGARLMLKEGLFDTYKPEVAFGLHVNTTVRAGDVGYRAGPFMAASDRFRIVVNGRQTHGARPWQGIDPVVTSAEIITALQTVVSRRVDLTANPAVLTVGVISAGSRFNIVPESAEMLGTLRTFDTQQRADIMQHMQTIVQSLGAANDASATLSFGEDSNPVTFNNVALTERVVPSLKRAAGADHVQALPLETGAEDFAHFAQKVPSFYFYVGITPPDKDPHTVPVNHSPLFYIDESGLPVGLKSMLYVATDYLRSGSKRVAQRTD
ncbi:MAG TPA: amidohydrolase [Steroidobacteraceae bacterium]|nr:amidohydrolase [Steroidobacteraceae bacterium]